MIVAVLAFATLYAACAGLLLAVWLQDRRRGAMRAGDRPARDPRATQEFVFRTQA
jgi:hypothetical protein